MSTLVSRPILNPQIKELAKLSSTLSPIKKITSQIKSKRDINYKLLERTPLLNYIQLRENKIIKINNDEISLINIDNIIEILNDELKITQY